MALRTRSRISLDTYPVPFTTSETVLRDTPAFFATSRMPTTIAPSSSCATSALCFKLYVDLLIPRVAYMPVMRYYSHFTYSRTCSIVRCVYRLTGPPLTYFSIIFFRIFSPLGSLYWIAYDRHHAISIDVDFRAPSTHGKWPRSTTQEHANTHAGTRKKRRKACDSHACFAPFSRFTHSGALRARYAVAPAWQSDQAVSTKPTPYLIAISQSQYHNARKTRQLRRIGKQRDAETDRNA